MATADLLLHPVRLRLVKAFLGDRTLTARQLAEEFRELAAFHVTVIVSGIKRASEEWRTIAEWTDSLTNMRYYFLLDAAIEWAEDQVVYRHGGSIDVESRPGQTTFPLLLPQGSSSDRESSRFWAASAEDTSPIPPLKILSRIIPNNAAPQPMKIAEE